MSYLSHNVDSAKLCMKTSTHTFIQTQLRGSSTWTACKKVGCWAMDHELHVRRMTIGRMDQGPHVRRVVVGQMDHGPHITVGQMDHGLHVRRSIVGRMDHGPHVRRMVVGQMDSSGLFPLLRWRRGEAIPIALLSRFNKSINLC